MAHLKTKWLSPVGTLLAILRRLITILRNDDELESSCQPLRY